MSGILESASAILSMQDKRLAAAGENVANINTAGYKSQMVFSQLIDGSNKASERNSNGLTDVSSIPQARTATDFTAGKLNETDNPFDFAISGSGFFQVRTTDGGVGYTRQGQFQRDADNHLVTAQGALLQAEGGGDITVRSNSFKVAQDGTLTENREPTARIGLYDFADPTTLTRADGGVFRSTSAQAADSSVVRQGYLEASNVSTAADMVKVLESVRIAQSAQRLVLTYDDLMNRVFTTLGQMQ